MTASLRDQERALMSAILICDFHERPDRWTRIARCVKPDDFVDDFFRDMFAACLTVARSVGVPEHRAVMAEVRRRRTKVTTTEIVDLVRALSWYLPTPTYLEYYALAVVEAAARRLSIGIMEDLEQSPNFNDSIHDAQIQLSEIRERLSQLRGDTVNTATDDFSETAIAFLDSIDSDTSPGVPTALAALDEYIGGPIPLGSLVILGAVPGTGKTLFLMQALMKAAKAGRRCVLISQEMSFEMIGERLVAMTSGATRKTIARRDVQAIKSVVRADMEGLHISFRQTEPTAEAITGMIARESDNGATVFAVDYLQLLSGKGKSRYEQITNVSSEIKSTTARCGVVTWLASQLNRESLKTRPPIPQSFHLRDSGQIEADADVILMLRRPINDSDAEQVASALDKNGLAMVDPAEYFQIFVRKVRNRVMPSDPLFNCRVTSNPFRLAPVMEVVF